MVGVKVIVVGVRELHCQYCYCARDRIEVLFSVWVQPQRHVPIAESYQYIRITNVHSAFGPREKSGTALIMVLDNTHVKCPGKQSPSPPDKLSRLKCFTSFLSSKLEEFLSLASSAETAESRVAASRVFMVSRNTLPNAHTSNKRK